MSIIESQMRIALRPILHPYLFEKYVEIKKGIMKMNKIKIPNTARSFRDHSSEMAYPLARVIFGTRSKQSKIFFEKVDIREK